MQLKKALFSKAPFTTGLKTACSVLALTACLAAGGAQAADQGPRHHARGQYDTVTATYIVVEGDELVAIGERFEIPVDALKAQNKLPSDEVKVGQKLVVAASAGSLKGQVLGGGAPIAKSTVTLWAASEGAPTQLTQTQTGEDGRFELRADGAPGSDAVLYLVATGGQPTASKGGGDNPAIVLMTVLGSKPPANVVINEMTTVASVWTHAQFLKREELSGTKLGLRIAAGNVPNLVDLETGGLGPVIQDPLNSSQTATLATFNTLANLLAGCITRVHGDACNKLFTVATPPAGVAPTDTLMAAQNIARNPSHQAPSLFALLDAFYPVPTGELWRPVPFIPYLRACEKISESRFLLPEFDENRQRHEGNDPHE